MQDIKKTLEMLNRSLLKQGLTQEQINERMLSHVDPKQAKRLAIERPDLSALIDGLISKVYGEKAAA
jgi:hypothetical protein